MWDLAIVHLQCYSFILTYSDCVKRKKVKLSLLLNSVLHKVSATCTFLLVGEVAHHSDGPKVVHSKEERAGSDPVTTETIRVASISGP